MKVVLDTLLEIALPNVKEMKLTGCMLSAILELCSLAILLWNCLIIEMTLVNI